MKTMKKPLVFIITFVMMFCVLASSAFTADTVSAAGSSGKYQHTVYTRTENDNSVWGIINGAFSSKNYMLEYDYTVQGDGTVMLNSCRPYVVSINKRLTSWYQTKKESEILEYDWLNSEDCPNSSYTSSSKKDIVYHIPEKIDNRKVTVLGPNLFNGSNRGGLAYLNGIVVPQYVEHIQWGCFANCSGLEAVLILGEKNLKSIQDYAFASCPKLTTVMFGDREYIFDAFSRSFDNPYIDLSYCYNLTRIGEGAFIGTCFNEVYLTRSVGKNIGKNAFGYSTYKGTYSHAKIYMFTCAPITMYAILANTDTSITKQIHFHQELY